MRRALLIAGLLMFALPAGAASDIQPWTELGVRYKLSRQFRLKFDQHFRFDEEFRGHSRHSLISELAASWRVFRFLRLEAGYRYIAEITESFEDPYTDSWHRFFVDARLRYRIKPVTLHYRLRLQEQFGKPWGNDALEYIHTIRNKIGVEVKLAGGFVPFLSGELFLRIDDPDGALHKWRLTAGLDYEIGSHTITAFYRMEEMLGDPQDPTRHILGTGYHYAF
jgi:hypothetical protein